uniref:Uncharacterized protein n=1 Tax=Cucumis melo TaxID=3656 RepID=A0A9I9EEJ5_CUCME
MAVEQKTGVPLVMWKEEDAPDPVIKTIKSTFNFTNNTMIYKEMKCREKEAVTFEKEVATFECGFKEHLCFKEGKGKNLLKFLTLARIPNTFLPHFPSKKPFSYRRRNPSSSRYHRNPSSSLYRHLMIFLISKRRTSLSMFAITFLAFVVCCHLLIYPVRSQVSSRHFRLLSSVV